MGLSNKLATKIRTSDKRVPGHLPDPWDDNGMLTAAAAVRGAAAAIGQLKLSSSGVRGSDFLSIRQAMYAGASVIWVEQRGLREWRVSLGQATARGQALDWQLRFTVSATPDGQLVEVTTPAVTTRDGILLNKDAYGELRDLVLTGMAEGRAPAADTELAVSQASLSVPALTPVGQKGLGQTVDVAISTELSLGDLTGCLRLVPYPMLRADGNTVLWQLGSSPVGPAQIAEGTMTDLGAQRSLRLHRRPQPTGRYVPDVLISERAYALPLAVLQVVQAYDPGATRTDVPLSTQVAGDEEAR